MHDFDELRDEYAKLIRDMKVTRASEVAAAIKKYGANRSRYEAVSKQTGVPWQFIAVLHMRESGGNFKTHLHNGDALTARTWHVPAGRPKKGSPPFTWEESAVDALTMKGYDKITDWSMERMAWAAEKYNGWGYRNRGVPSAYLWSGTNIYRGGKYIADGVWSSSAMDKQLGVMPVLRGLMTSAPEVPEMSMDMLAKRIVAAMRKINAPVDEGDDVINIVYVEGMDTDGKANRNRRNAFDDLRVVLRVGKGGPKILGCWESTIETGDFFTFNRMNQAGAARIAFGYQKAWQVGRHRQAYEALVQTGRAVRVYRDDNEDFDRANDEVAVGFFGINQHHGYNAPRDNIGKNSAGCLVGRMVKGHEEFMALVKSDRRYRANHSFVFGTTVLKASDVLNVPMPKDKTGPVAGAVVTAGGTAVAAHRAGMSPWMIGVLIAVVAIVAFGAWHFMRKK